MTSLDYGIYNALVEEKKQTLFKSIRSRLTRKQLNLIKLAVEVADNAHFHQRRKSGEPYIIHPLEVATIIAQWSLDEQSIAGAILHDVVEDTDVTIGDIEQIFGQNIATLVDSVTKLEKLNFESDEIAHAEYFRKVVLAMAKDIRVILIKLADRLHNMLTLGSMQLEKRKRIALETMEIYVPIANKVGLHKIHSQLANESFKYLHPLRNLILTKAVDEVQKQRLPIIERLLQNISNALKSNGITAIFVYNKRSIYNLYRRMKVECQNFNQIYDVFEINIIVENIRDCYLTLGVLHNMYTPVPGKFKDYIAIPKSNGYQSLHSTLMGPHGTPLQIHVRTKSMDEIAENGILSHWLKHQHEESSFTAQERTNSWINNILDIQSSTFSANEFLESLKQSLSPTDIYVFTPKGKIMLLPKGATALDFAYFIHSDVGNHCFRAKINQKFVKLSTRVSNGDIVEIITNDSIEPQELWLKFVVSGKAINKIKQYFKEQKFDVNIQNGIKMLNLGLSLFQPKIKADKTIFTNLIAKHYSKLSIIELQHKIGVGDMPVLEVVKKILNMHKKDILNVKLSQCKLPIIQDEYCLPLPGYNIVARITRDGQLLLHRASCKVERSLGLDNLTFIHIINDSGRNFATKIKASISNTVGTFAKVTGIIGEKGIDIIELVQTYTNNDTAAISATLGVKSLTEAEELIETLRSKDFIIKANLV